MDDFADRAQGWDADTRKSGRAAAVADAIRTEVAIPRGARGLEFGAGTGLLSVELRDDLGSAVLVDRSAAMLEVASGTITALGLSHLRTMQMDLADDPLPAERFDLIYSLMALHHVPDTDGILRRFHALLDPGGHLCLADLDTEDGSYHRSGSDGLHPGFDRDALRHQLEAAGFEDVRVRWVLDLPKVVDGEPRSFPVFLAVARRP
jgi:2-polyprenyl-3-methyl-5-hydroxy-6-metoxy-1,4-benzoquinol methylase